MSYCSSLASRAYSAQPSQSPQSTHSSRLGRLEQGTNIYLKALVRSAGCLLSAQQKSSNLRPVSHAFPIDSTPDLHNLRTQLANQLSGPSLPGLRSPHFSFIGRWSTQTHAAADSAVYLGSEHLLEGVGKVNQVSPSSTAESA